jgi:hypothetical protein
LNDVDVIEFVQFLLLIPPKGTSMFLKAVVSLFFIAMFFVADLFAGGSITRILLSSDKTFTNGELLAVRESTIVVVYPPNVSEESLTRKGVIVMEIQKSVIKSIILVGAGDGYTGTGAVVGSIAGVAVAAALLSGVADESNSGTHRADGTLVVLGIVGFGGIGAGVGALLGSTFKEDVVVEPSSMESLAPLRLYARYVNEEPEFLQSTVNKRVGY